MNVEQIFTVAHEAGRKAAAEVSIKAMTVCERENPLDDRSKSKRSWMVSGGVCGFAWVNIKPANSRIAKYMVTLGVARKDSYDGGVRYWIRDYGQSMQMKEAYAHAFAQVLSNNGIRAYASSRMD